MDHTENANKYKEFVERVVCLHAEDLIELNGIAASFCLPFIETEREGFYVAAGTVKDIIALLPVAAPTVHSTTAAEWISADDKRKPKGRTPVLVAVDYVRYGEYEDGTPGEFHGNVVAEGEYVPQHGEAGDYFTCYSSPHGDADVVTHWMPFPPAPGQQVAHVPTAAEIRAICMIQPMPIERDADGSWSHPGIPNFDEDHKSFSAWLAAVELETTHKMLEWEDSDHPVYVSYFDNEDPSFAAWEPQPPAGDGWFTFSIHDTEDGPVWVWARRALAGQQVAQGEKGGEGNG